MRRSTAPWALGFLGLAIWSFVQPVIAQAPLTEGHRRVEEAAVKVWHAFCDAPPADRCRNAHPMAISVVTPAGVATVDITVTASLSFRVTTGDQGLAAVTMADVAGTEAPLLVELWPAGD